VVGRRREFDEIGGLAALHHEIIGARFIGEGSSEPRAHLHIPVTKQPNSAAPCRCGG